ncbi:unnamed protein product [Knipowitschia caucasica]|uniref:RRM domain-containing protein n=1 Tax=Knipowitschia caucasica TaxID=637954 RepID=A0AAV2LZJ4_KNICA
MSSPLSQLVGPPLEIMHSINEKDTTYTKIFVGGLPYHTNDASLRKYFETFGEIDEAVVITDKQTGKSRGYGFVTMVDRGSAERACKDANPIIDGRKANVNLAYLGAKPRASQTSVSVGVQQIHPSWTQRQYGLTQHYLYPQTFLQPSVLLQSPLSSTSALASPYLDYSSVYAPFLEQYPYTASPSPSAGGYLGYALSPGTPAPTNAPSALHPSLSALATVTAPPATAFLHYPMHQPDRLQ